MALAEPALHLIDRGKVGLEAVPRGTQIETPDAHPLLPSDSHGFGAMLVEAPRPVTQGLHVVLPEPLDVLGHEVGSLEGEEHPGQVEPPESGKT